MNKSFLYKIGCVGLTIFTCLGQMSDTVYAVGDPDADASSGSVTLGEIRFECGSDALSCPSNITKYNGLTGPTTDLFTSYAGAKPIPTKSGYRFVDWKITSVSNNNDYAGTKMKNGDLMTDWNNIAIGSLFSISRWVDGSSENDYSGYSLELEAVWEKAMGNDQSIPVQITIPSNPINVTLPSSIELVFDGSNVAGITANNFSITNNSKIGNVKVRQITAAMNQSGWTLTSESADSYFQTKPLDSKELYLGFAKGENPFSALTANGLDPDITIGPVGVGNTQNFKIEAKTSGSSTKVDTDLVNLIFTIEYETAGEQSSTQKAGMYKKDGTLVKAWNQLIADGDITLDSTKYKITGANKKTLNGELYLPNSITVIGQQAFASCDNLSAIILPESLNEIEYGAFQDCTSLGSIVIPNSVTSIGSEAFTRCTNLSTVSLSENLESIPDFVFAECINLKTITIPNAVTLIDAGAFAGCESLDDLIIPDSVTSIGDMAFYNIPHITYSGSATGSPWGALSMN